MDEKLDEDCADECICRIKQALGLIIEEIKRVDLVIKILASKKSKRPDDDDDDDDGHHLFPQPEEKREFVKCVEKNSSVCHVIIQELKNQRAEINEMLQLYESSRQDFGLLESSLNRQKGQEAACENAISNLLMMREHGEMDIMKNDVEMKSGCDTGDGRSWVVTTTITPDSIREEMLRTFVEWITGVTLEGKFIDEFHLKIEKAILERNKERIMLTLAVKQLQQVRKIELLMSEQQQGGEAAASVCWDHHQFHYAGYPHRQRCSKAKLIVLTANTHNTMPRRPR